MVVWIPFGCNFNRKIVKNIYFIIMFFRKISLRYITNVHLPILFDFRCNSKFGKNRNDGENRNCGKKSKFCSLQKSKFSKIEMELKIKHWFWSKVQICSQKSKILVKNLIFGQELKFGSKIDILVKNRSFGQRSKCWLTLKFWSKIEILVNIEI